MSNRRSLGINVLMDDAWGQTNEVHKRLSIVAAELWPIRTENISVYSTSLDEVEDKDNLDAEPERSQNQEDLQGRVRTIIRNGYGDSTMAAQIVLDLADAGITFRSTW